MMTRPTSKSRCKSRKSTCTMPTRNRSRAGRRNVLRRSPQLPGQERAATDGDHFGRRDHERDLRVHLRHDCVWHGCAVHAGGCVGSGARLAGVGSEYPSRAMRSCRSANRVNPTFIQLKSGVTLGDLEKGIELRVRRAADGKVVTVPLKPQQTAGKLATIGLSMPLSLTLFGEPARRLGGCAGEANQAGSGPSPGRRSQAIGWRRDRSRWRCRRERLSRILSSACSATREAAAGHGSPRAEARMTRPLPKTMEAGRNARADV